MTSSSPATAIAGAAAPGELPDPVPVPEKLPIGRFDLPEERRTHLHFYVHETASGDRPSVIDVVPSLPAYRPSTLFGAVYVHDDPLTTGPSPGSGEIGRAQGFYALSSTEGMVLQMVLSFVFFSGDSDGGSIAVQGRYSVAEDPVKELPIVGGSGRFRMARGYALFRRHSFNAATLDTVLEVDLFVLHYADQPDLAQK